MVLTETSSEMIGRRYQLQHKLGVGGMGAVYAATDRLTGEMIALKRVSARRASLDNASLRLALTREFQTLATLRHPNVIGVLDYGFDGLRQPYFTMALLDGAASVREVGRHLPLMRKLDLLLQLLQALVYLHRRGIIHRDLKPDNVLVTAEGQVKVLDFGLAVANARRGLEQYAGTLRYMAPEVLYGEPPQPASDLYSVGVMAYELLTGHHPFTGNTAQELLNSILSHQPDMTGIDILTSGELRHQARRAQAAPAPSEDTVRYPAGAMAPERTPDTADTWVQDDLPTTVIDPQAFTQGRALPDTAPESNNPFVRILQKLLAKYPERRYQSARDVIDDLRAAMGEPVPPESADIRESFLQSARFVGRAQELDQLAAGLSDAIMGTGSLWLVGGESGVGKSRLLDELRTVAMVEGVAVLRGQAVREGGLPYQMWREPLRHLLLSLPVSLADAAVLKQVVPDMDRLLEQPVPDAPALEAGDAQERLLITLGRLFEAYARANPGGVLVLLEDVQWAAESLYVLNRLHPLLFDLPLMVVCSYRNDEAPHLPAQVEGGRVLPLQRLSPDSIADLSESMLGAAGRNPEVVALIQRETEGNVFFMIEVARALAEEAGELDRIGLQPLPARVFAGGIQTLLQRRLDRVAPEYRPLLQWAAVHGRQVDMAVMAALAGADAVDDWLTACANAAVMDAQDGRWRFAHDRLREQVLASLPEPARPALYQQVAEAVEAVYAGETDAQAAVLAHLWRHTGHHAKTYHYTRMAADAAHDISAYTDAERFYSRALTMVLNGDVAYAASEEISLRIRLGEIAGALSQYERANEALETALALARSAESPHQSAEALIGLGWVTLRQGDVSRARWQSEEAFELVRGRGDAALLVEASHLNGLIDVIEGRYEDAEELLSACLPLAQTLPDRRYAADVLNTLGTVEERLGRHAQATALLTEALHLATALGNRNLAASVGANLGRLSHAQGQDAEARAYFEEALRRFRLVGNVYDEASALSSLGFIALEHGDLDGSLALLQESVDVSLRIGAAPVTLVALSGIARLLSVVGEKTRAAELLGLVLTRAADADVERAAIPLLNALGEQVPPDVLDAALERGKARRLESVAEDIQILTRAVMR